MGSEKLEKVKKIINEVSPYDFLLFVFQQYGQELFNWDEANFHKMFFEIYNNQQIQKNFGKLLTKIEFDNRGLSIHSEELARMLSVMQTAEIMKIVAPTFEFAIIKSEERNEYVKQRLTIFRNSVDLEVLEESKKIIQEIVRKSMN